MNKLQITHSKYLHFIQIHVKACIGGTSPMLSDNSAGTYGRKKTTCCLNIYSKLCFRFIVMKAPYSTPIYVYPQYLVLSCIPMQSAMFNSLFSEKCQYDISLMFHYPVLNGGEAGCRHEMHVIYSQQPSLKLTL